MNMKRACTEEQIEIRKNEIIQAVNTMFDTMDYQDISMKTISERISIARSSLYCYYFTKEEILLDVLKDGYTKLFSDLINTLNKKYSAREELADSLTKVYLSQLRLLKMVSVHLTDIEDHCSLDKLIEFKSGFVQVMVDLYKAVQNQFPTSTQEEVQVFFSSLMMLTHGLYPMICPHPKQKQAMKAVGMMTNDDSYSYCFNYIKFLVCGMN